jgi:predicted phage terminase large subunit-like protein
VDLYGNLKPHSPDRWTQNQLIITRNKILKDPTFTALGVGQGVIGIRADEIICDDVQDETRARSEVIRASDRAWFRKELLGRLEPDGRLLYICNRYHMLDLAGELLNEAKDNPDLWTILQEPAINKDNKALWEDRWPLAGLLARKREVGSAVFQCVWQGDPTALIGNIFKAEWIEYYQIRPALDTLRIVMGVDLAISEKQSADCFAIVILGMDKDGIIYLLDYYQGRLDFPAQLKMVEAYAAAYHPIRIAVEQTAYQKAFVQAIRPSVLPIVGVDARGDKQARIQQLAPYIEAKTFRVSKQQDDFIMQLLQFPQGEHDDLLDAAEIALRQLGQIWIQPRVDMGDVRL